MEQKKLQAAIEAILFAMGGSVELKKLAQAIGHDEETTKKIIRQMMDRYEKEDRGIRIIELEASFQMCTKKEMYEYLIRVAKQPKKQVLTDVLLETLSIIAYKGTDCGPGKERKAWQKTTKMLQKPSVWLWRSPCWARCWDYTGII